MVVVMGIGGKYKTRKIVEELFKQHYAELCSHVYSIVKNDNDAEDIVQQFFVDFIVNKRYKKVESSMEGYLFQSVRYAALKFLKHQIKNQHLQISDFSDVFLQEEHKKENSQITQQLDTALNSLPPRCKEVFVMVHVQNLSYIETSKVLGVSINTVKTQLKRGLNLLRERISYPLNTELN
ncbi:RNA polymerase sigma factor [Maribellus sediminis]|uniref:RNA polymerase sigma factor n=1 Tax=Maribellus sediminis TaxID=2696285 RepID=UPI0014301284|nr:sigma-70 family RNA polymerase sigma factor [Maribellus sediminis]